MGNDRVFLIHAYYRISWFDSTSLFRKFSRHVGLSPPSAPFQTALRRV